MKYVIPMLAVLCFAIGGCKSTCCGSCGGDKAHGHSHADGEKCCGKCKKEDAKAE